MTGYLSFPILMDEQVIAAMARWPNVPAVYGWLSLTESGHWRLHPQGDALLQPDSPGEDITSPQILVFMGRNYASDDHGQWFFQNGPQRVYVRLDAAPFIAHTTTDTATGRLRLRTHTGQDIREISALYLDDTGRMYAATELGAALIAGRDLPSLLDALQLAGSQQGDLQQALLRCLETGASLTLASTDIQGFNSRDLALHYCPSDALEARLGFQRHPRPPAESGPAAGTPDSPISG